MGMRLKSLLILPLLVASLQAASLEDLTFTLIGDGTEYSVTDCDSSASGSLEIPSTYNDLPVTSIGDFAFDFCSSLTSITIPDSVTSIGAYTFAFCSSLTSVTIGDSVTSIGRAAFNGLTDLTSVTFQGDAPTFGTYVFTGSDSVTIYYDIYKSGWSSTVAGRPAEDTSPMTFTLNGAVTECSVTDCDEAASGSLIIPSTYNGLPVTSIGENAFENCSSVSSITIPDSVTAIGTAAFASCFGLTSFTIPDSVTSIESATFAACSQLTSITIPDSVTSIGAGAFNICTSLTSITIPDSVTSIGSSAFQGCFSLTSITIGNSVTSIGEGAFRRCYNTSSIIIPDSVTSIGEEAFEYCSGLTSINIPSSVTSIGDRTFYECANAGTAYFEGSAPTTIGTEVFSNTQIPYIIVGGSVAESYGGEGATYGGLMVVDSSKVATAANLHTQSEYVAVVAERDAAEAERDARLTMEEVRDARIGSTMIEVSEGKADITMTLEETSDLSDWSSGAASDTTIQVDAPSGTRFYRFKMTE
jgi:hypothetical protein